MVLAHGCCANVRRRHREFGYKDVTSYGLTVVQGSYTAKGVCADMTTAKCDLGQAIVSDRLAEARGPKIISGPLARV